MSDTFTDSGRTPEDDFLGIENNFNTPQYEQFLDYIFNFGVLPDETFELFDGYKVRLRLLTPAENIEVSKALDDGNIITKELVHKIETLARSIVNINGNKLRFPDHRIKEYLEFKGIVDQKYVPSEVEQQKFIIKYNFKPAVINIIYEKYSELVKKQESILADLKKK